MKINSSNLSFFTLVGKIKFRLIEKVDQKIFSKVRNKKINNKDFTIISNNCFAGWVYRIFNLEYLTPTVGLFIMPDDYLKFIENLEYYLSLEMKFISSDNSKHSKYLSEKVKKFGKYPIGLLEDVEIHFLHYENEKEALEKWNRRKKRININKIIFKFNDQNGCKREHIEKFTNMKFKNKICFVSNEEYKNIKGTIFIKEFKKNGYVVDDTWFARKYLNLKKSINEL